MLPTCTPRRATPFSGSCEFSGPIPRILSIWVLLTREVYSHAALDKIWDQWQRANWNARKSDIAGPDTNFAYPFNFFGDVPYKNITINHPMDFPKFGKSLTVKDVMDTKNAALCYTYA
jgi:hypothetical protein